MTDKKNVEIPINHPMEGVLDIEEGTTNVPAVKRTSEVAVAVTYDKKDSEIDEQFQEIYDLSLEAYEIQAQEAELVEGKYKARAGEVAAQYLTIALNAAKDKATLKINKDKSTIQAEKLSGSGKLTQNNLIVGDRNDIIKALLQSQQPELKDIPAESPDETK